MIGINVHTEDANIINVLLTNQINSPKKINKRIKFDKEL